MKQDIETKRFEGLVCIHGNPGKGKTYFLQKLALQYYKDGYVCVLLGCGWSIDGAIHIDLSEELNGIYLDPKNYKARIAIFCDEANSIFPARDWSHTSKESRDYFAMFRHAGVTNFFYTTQDWEDVEKILRSKTEFVWQCGFIRPFRLFYHRKFAKGDFLKIHSQVLNARAKPYAVTMFFAKSLKGTNYDTYARFDKIASLAPQNPDIIDYLSRLAAVVPLGQGWQRTKVKCQDLLEKLKHKLKIKPKSEKQDPKIIQNTDV